MPQPTPSLDTFCTERLQTDLRGHSVRGGVLTVSSQGTQFVLQTVSTVVLARLLTHEDFGLVAMVTAITGLGQAFADLGLSEATIQREDINHEQVSNLFWINVAVGLTLMLITMGLAPVLAWFYREPRLKSITLVLSLTFLIGGLRVQHDALLKRQMRFFSLAMRDIISVVVSVAVGILMAWKGFGYWAIIAGPLSGNTVRMALSWLGVRWIPGPPRRDVRVGSMVAFGGNVAFSYIIYNINRSADGVLVGWRWGAGPLGLYSRAYSLLMLPLRQLGAPIGNVLVPAFSRVQTDPERFARYYLRAVNITAWISTPIFGFLFVAAEPVIVLTLGRGWREAAPVFQILAISALAQMLVDMTVWSFVSRGQSGRLLKLLLILSPVLLASFAIGLPFGIRGVALSGSLVLVGIFPWILKYSFRGTVLTLARLGDAILYPIALSLAGVFTAEVALRLFVPKHVLAQLLVSALGFVVAYAVAVLIPRVRREINALKDLASGLNPFRQVA